MSQRSGATSKVATLRLMVQRFAYIGLVLAAFFLMMIAKAETLMVETIRAQVVDAFTPIVQAISKPVATAAGVVERIGAMVDLEAENTRLREENARLLQWQDAARRFGAENEILRKQLNFNPGPAVNYVSARVIADDGGVYSESLLIYAGHRDGVRNGQAVTSGEGLVGRISGVAERSARILLVTDLNSRIPVRFESSRIPAILAGRNNDILSLVQVPPGTIIEPGDRLVTSGHGGAFPEGIPVGVVTRVADKSVDVAPFIDPHRLELVRVVDYGLEGILNRQTLRTDLPDDLIPPTPQQPASAGPAPGPGTQTLVPPPGAEARPSEP